MSVRIIQGEALDVLRTLDAESVQCVVTSPPYWGLRDYGLPPTVWGGEPDCEHEWGDEQKPAGYRSNENRNTDGLASEAIQRRDQWQGSNFCQLCGAWRGQLGLEPTPELYVEHLVDVFREVKRVLRDDGVLWLNLGDSYASGGQRQTGRNDADNEFRPGRAESGEKTRFVADSGLKPKDLCGIPWRVAFALQADGWWLRSDIIWCLSGGTRVYAKTQKGVLPMMIKDMVRLDPATVQLWNGEKWTQVLGWSETPRADNSIEVELRSGERIGCTPNHEWPTQRGNVRADELRVGDVIQTCQLPDEPQGAFDQPYIAAWARFVGLYLAEGSRTGNKIQISGHTKETDTRLKLCREVADSLDGTVYAYEDGNKTTIFVTGKMVNALVDQYISGHDAHDKHLSPKVWKRPNSFLREILTGYLMGDGHYDVTNDRWRLGFCRNYNWEQDLRTLCARLGIQLRLKLSTSVSQSGVFPAFRGELRFNRGNHHNAKHDGEVVRIGRSKARKFWDIGVEDEPHIFALASGVLTHNSKPNPMPESVTDRCTKAHEYVFMLSKSARYYYDAQAIAEPATAATNERDKYVRTGYQKETRDGYVNHLDPNSGAFRDCHGTRNRRDVWTIATQPYSGAHYAVMPPALAEVCIKAGTSERGRCPECGAPWERVVERGKAQVTNPRPFSKPGNEKDRNDVGRIYEETTSTTIGWRPTCTCPEHTPVPCIVLDPFSGAGTTGLVADRLGRDAVLIELKADNCEMAEQRIKDDAGMWGTIERYNVSESLASDAGDMVYYS